MPNHTRSLESTAVPEHIAAVRAAMPMSVGKADPRTLFVALLLINILVLSTVSLTTALACGVLVTLAHVTAGLNRVAWSFIVTLSTSAALFGAGFLIPGNHVITVLAMVGFWTFRFVTVAAAAGYLARSVTPGEFTTALYRMRVPHFLRIPLIVMLRFFPLAKAELHAVRDAAALRGIPLGLHAWLRHPLRSTEYVMVPMLASCSRIADDLTASGLVRGLGTTKQPAAFVPLKFGLADVWVILGVALLVSVHFLDLQVPGL